jgi:hypothetical protein
VVYSSSVLSPAERDVLARLQRAENEVLGLAHQRDLRDRAVALEMALQEERLRTQRLINDTLYNENSVNYPYPPATPSAAGLLLLTNYSAGLTNLASSYGLTAVGNPKGVIISLPQVIPAVSIVDRLPPGDAQAASKAREEWAQLQNMAVYEDGRLVAVLVK